MSARARDGGYKPRPLAAAGVHAGRDSERPTDSLAIAAEVLSPAEVAALNARERVERGSANTNANPFAALGPVRFSDVLSPAELADLRGKVKLAKQELRQRREAARRLKREATARALAGKPATPTKREAVDEAIGRAEHRERELAARTPERLWTPAMRRAMARKPGRPT